MTWFRIDDSLATHQKARAAGLTSMGLWVVSGAYASQQLTDGYVPDWYVSGWPGGRRAVARLLESGLWRVAGDGWEFHEWSERNPSREDELEKRRQHADRQREWRDKRRSEREKGVE